MLIASQSSKMVGLGEKQKFRDVFRERVLGNEADQELS
jgi:hypothetical protein